MKILQTHSFKSAFKKLHLKQKKAVEFAIKTIISEPNLGVQKKGDLREVYVYKFKFDNAQQLLAYSLDEDMETITLLQLGSHENFYRDLKKS